MERYFFFLNHIMRKSWNGMAIEGQKWFDLLFVLFLYNDTCFIKWLITSLLNLKEIFQTYACLMDNLSK